jgi:hypothetical protein
VFGTVVLENPPHLGQPRHRKQVAEQHEELESARDEVKARVLHPCDPEETTRQPAEPLRRALEQQQREQDGHEADPAAPARGLVRQRSPLFIDHLLRHRELQRAHAHRKRLDERRDATKEGELPDARRRKLRAHGPLLHGDPAVGSPHRDRHAAGCTHHHAFDDGLPADVWLGVAHDFGI